MYTNQKAIRDLVESDGNAPPSHRSAIKSDVDTRRNQTDAVSEPGNRTGRKIVINNARLKADRFINGDTLTQAVFGD
jgi:hypothetical protein